ncbi:MAG: TSUP family transporter [Thermoleophilaceae bacterium]
MELADLIGALAIGLAAGIAGGLVGVGGGVLLVPGLVIFLGASQLWAEATSLLATVLVAGVGAWRQSGYGNLRLRDGLVIGVLSPLGVLAGTVVANAVPERALELSFAAVQLGFAYELARRAIGGPHRADDAPVNASG